MDFGFEGFESSDFEAELEDLQVKKLKKFDRMWSVKSGGSVWSIPLIKDGIVYFGAYDNKIYAVDSETGKEIWRVDTGGPIVANSPIIHKDRLFMGSNDGYLYCIGMNGKIVWKYKTGGGIACSTPNFFENLVYFGSRDGYVYAIDIDSGKEIWRFRTGDVVVSSPTVRNSRLYIGSYDSNMYCLDCETGREIWRKKVGSEIVNECPFEIHYNVLYFSSFDNYVYAVNAETGKEIWRFKTGQYGNSFASVVYNGMIYHACRDGILFAISLEGKELWRKKFDGCMYSKVVIEQGKIYFAVENGKIYCMNIDGEILWEFKTSADLTMCPTISGDKLYFGAWDCHLYCLDLEGKELWRFATSSRQQAEMSSPYSIFKMEIKKETGIEEIPEEKKYKKKKEETVSLSDYQIESEYSHTSEYKQKSDYDTSFVMFEGILEGEELWISDSRDLIPRTLMWMLKR